MENWRFIEENPDYMVSDHGRVLSFKGKAKLILCTTIAGEGYEQTELMQKGIYTKYYTHRLVAKAFIPNPKHLPQVNHLDGNTLNNHVSNLEWCDAHDNIMHAIRMGLRPPGKTGSKYSGVPCAVTDASGNTLRAYPSMQAMSKGEHMNPAFINWLRLQLRYPERLLLHNLRVRQHRGDAFIMKEPVPLSPAQAVPQTSPAQAVPQSSHHRPVPPVQSPCIPVQHPVNRQYYRQLSEDEAIAFGFAIYTSRNQQERGTL